MGSASIAARAIMPPDGNAIQAASVAGIVGECGRMPGTAVSLRSAVTTPPRISARTSSGRRRRSA
jgi:hypothetical protein